MGFVNMTRILYYVEVNLICIVVLLLIFHQLRRNATEQFSTSRISFNRIVIVAVLLCISDAVACGCNSMTFPGARAVIEISNIIYYEAMALASYLWMQYVNIRINPDTPMKKEKQWLWVIPLLAITVLTLINPLTHFMFTIDAQNVYSRGPGVVWHWVIMWMYMIASVVQTTRALLREKRRHKRRELAPLLLFIIAPVVCGVAQMVVYGVTSTQVGITVSLLIIFLSLQGSQVLTDSLTGLNNRRAFDNFVMDYLQHHSNETLSLLMLDINNFKMVNDKYGHMMGDRALQDVAEVLKQICAEMPRVMFLCRYGGDEFLIAGIDRTQEEIVQLKGIIRTELARKSASVNMPYVLEVGVGTADGKCVDSEDAEHLLRVADEAMYEDKKQAKRAAAAH